MKPGFNQFVGTLVVIGLSQAAQAADATWTGLGADSSWTTTGNWSTSPVPGTGNTAIFDGTGNGKTTITTAPGALSSYVFNAGSAAYTISAASTTWSVPSGGGVTVNSGVTTNQSLSGIQLIRPEVNSTVNFSNQGSGQLKLGTIFSQNAGTGTTNARLNFTPGINATIEVSGNLDNAGNSGSNAKKMSILLNDDGTLKISGSGSFDGTDADGNSVTIRRGTLMVNTITNASPTWAFKSSLGTNGRIQFGEAGQTRTATLDYYNVANATTNRAFQIIDNNTAVFKVSGGASTNLIITSSITQSGSASGGAKLTKDGVGILTLGASNSHSNQTLISAGRLVVGHANALGTAGTFNSRTTINTGATLELATDTSVANEFLDITSGNTGAIVVNRATDGEGITHSTGTTYLGSGSTMNVTQGARVTSGTATLGIASVILASGSVGTATLNSDTAAISVTGAVSSGVNFNKTLTLTGSHTGSAISGAISNGSATGDNKVSLIKSGTGTWTLSNTNTYTGDTTVKAGTLALGASGTVANSTKLVVGDAGSSGAILDVSAKTGGFTLGATQTLSGIGSVDANDGVNKYTITMANGATHAAGNSSANGGVGKQTVDGNLNYGAGSVFEWTLNGNTTASGDRGVAGGYDAVDGTGTLAVDATEDTGTIFRIVLGSGVEVVDGFWDTPNTSHTWSDIFSGFSSLTGGFHTSNIEVIGGPENFATHGSFSITSSSLTWTAVPEPTTALAGLLLTAGLLRRRRG